MNQSETHPAFCKNGHLIAEVGLFVAKNGKTSCRGCRRAHSAKNYSNRTATGVHFKHKLKKQYGLTPEQYLEMLAAQGGKCLLCAITIKRPYKRSQRKGEPNGHRVVVTHDSIAVDHCHVTGKVRGLLCTMCNRGLGDFYDKPEVLRRAADYLEGHVH